MSVFLGKFLQIPTDFGQICKKFDIPPKKTCFFGDFNVLESLCFLSFDDFIMASGTTRRLDTKFLKAM